MPSLKSFNLTSEQLYNMPFKPIDPGMFELHKRTAEFNSVCMDQASKGAPQGDIMSCYNYLNNVNTNCAVTGGNNMEQVFCTAGNAMVVGMNIGSVFGGTSSRCDYVAFAVSWSYLNCLKAVPSQNSALVAAGSCAAYGNAALRVDTALVGSE